MLFHYKTTPPLYRVWLKLGLKGGKVHIGESSFKDLNDEIVGDAIIINGKQLFIDDYIIEDLTGATKILNQPVKHPRNPLIVPDKPWDKHVKCD